MTEIKMKPTLLIVIISLGLISCDPPNDKLVGLWDNKDGQIIEFKENGKALWIFYSETTRDTFDIRYKSDLSLSPHRLDLTDFKVGPLKGKTLYGIIEFQSERSFRFDCEPIASDRPKTFNPTQTQTFYKKQ